MSATGAGRALLHASLRARWRPVAAAYGATAVQQVAYLGTPLLVLRAVDDGVTRGDIGAAAVWAGATAVAALVVLVGQLGHEWFGGLAAADVAADLRRRLARTLLGLDRAALDGMGRGDVAMRVTRDVELVSTWVESLTWWLQVVLTIGLVLPAIWTLDPVLLYVALGTVPLIVLGNLVFPGRYRQRNEHLSAAHADRADAVDDLLSASAAVRGLGGEEVLVARHHHASSRVTEHTHGVARVAADWASLLPAVPWIGIAVGVFAGGLAVLDGRTTLGGVVAFTTWMTMFSVAVTFLVTLLAGRGDAVVAAGRIAGLLDARSVVTDPADPVPLPARGGLRATGVVVRRDGETVLGPVDLAVEPGEFVAVTGPTGSGKSTLTRLLCRFDDPDAGVVEFGGIDLRRASLADVRARVGVVAQRPVVLAGTVAENLRMGREPEPAPDEVDAAVGAAAFDRVLDLLDDGDATEVGERGSTLSGGQVQRLALARGLLARPPVLVLDDASSAVDALTEQRMIAGVRAHDPAAAVVWITTRPAVLAAADRVVRLAAPAGHAASDAPAADGAPAAPHLGAAASDESGPPAAADPTVVEARRG